MLICTTFRCEYEFVYINEKLFLFADIDELSLVSLNEPLPEDMESTDKDLTNFVSF